MKGRCLQILGTGSHVGKSLLTAAFCRIFREKGFSVAPFKAQNMALNSAVTQEGGEIGRAQAFQAEAAGLEPSVHMNPVLLKPTSHDSSQVILLGRPWKTVSVREYHRKNKALWRIIIRSLDLLRREHDVVVIEGAGSPAEPNLLRHDLVNLRVAKYADCPAILVGDISRGGVFASLLGTWQILKPADRGRIIGFVLNRFRGDISLLKEAVSFLQRRTRRPVLGVLPEISHGFPEEDSVGISNSAGAFPVGVIRLPRISNFTDFDALKKAGGVRFLQSPADINGMRALILPGTKNTLSDMRFLWESGWAKRLLHEVKRGKRLIGICGGFQMLGQWIRDPDGLEGRQKEIRGLGLFPMETTLQRHKITRQIEAEDLIFGTGRLKAYEIHMGRTRFFRKVQPAFRIQGGRLDGAVSLEKRVFGGYLHGLFDNPSFRQAFSRNLGLRSHPFPSQMNIASWADVVRDSLNLEKIEEAMGI